MSCTHKGFAVLWELLGAALVGYQGHKLLGDTWHPCEQAQPGPKNYSVPGQVRRGQQYYPENFPGS